MGSWSHPLSPRGAVCSGGHPGPLTVRPLLTIRHHLPLRPQYHVFSSAELSAGPECAVLFCDSGLLLTFLSSLPFSFPLCPNTSSFSPRPSCHHPAWCRLLPPYFSPLEPSPPFLGGGGACVLSVTHPAFSCKAELLGASSWFCVCGI